MEESRFRDFCKSFQLEGAADLNEDWPVVVEILRALSRTCIRGMLTLAA